MKLVVATRSPDKLREISAITRGVRGIELIDLDDAGIPWSDGEDSIEVFDSFEENAAAKAAYFRARVDLPVIADDSGLAVDALGGAPGVRSKRFAPGAEALSGKAQDQANLNHLLEVLGDRPLPQRSARYVCVAALELTGGRGAGSGEDGGPRLFRGEVEGLVLDRPQGHGGFGYDPVFFHPASGKTLAQMTPAEKDAVSHRGAAFRALSRELERCVNATSR